MAQIGILEDVVVPESPRTVDNEQLFVYVPVATYDNKGIASFSSDDFVIENGKVMLRVRLSEFEKTLSKKLDKYDKGGKGSILYGVTDDGEQAMFLSDRLPIEDTIAIRDENGNVKTNRPVENNDAINKFYGHNTFANALKGTVSGSAVAMKDVSPLEHELDVKVSSKNLISSIRPDTNVTVENGVVTQIESDTKELIVFKIQYRSIEGAWYQEEIILSTSDIGVLSIPFNIEYEVSMLRFGLNGSKFDSTVTFNILPKGTYVFSCNITNLTQGSISWRDMQIEKGTVATPYTPYLDDVSSVEVKRYGKNLLDYTKATDWRGNPLTIIEDGVLWDKNIGWYFFIPCHIPAYTPCKFSCKGDYAENPDTITGNEITLILKDGSDVYCGNGNGFICAQDVTTVAVRKTDSERTETEPIKVTHIQLELLQGNFDTVVIDEKLIGIRNATATPYEPYIEPTTYRVEADGTVNGVTPLYPSTTLITDNRALIECEYNRDINKAFEELRQIIISLGGNI